MVTPEDASDPSTWLNLRRFGAIAAWAHLAEVVSSLYAAGAVHASANEQDAARELAHFFPV